MVHINARFGLNDLDQAQSSRVNRAVPGTSGRSACVRSCFCSGSWASLMPSAGGRWRMKREEGVGGRRRGGRLSTCAFERHDGVHAALRPCCPSQPAGGCRGRPGSSRCANRWGSAPPQVRAGRRPRCTGAGGGGEGLRRMPPSRRAPGSGSRCRPRLAGACARRNAQGSVAPPVRR